MALSHFYLHLSEQGSVTEDDEGRYFFDTSAAIDAARRDARDIMCAGVSAGRLCLDCHIEVVHVGTGARTIVEFRDALTLVGC